VKVEPPEREITSQQNTHIDPPPGIAEGSVLAAFATSQNKVSTNDDSVGDIVEVAVQPVVLDKAAKVDLFKAVFLDSSDDEADNNPPSLPEVFSLLYCITFYSRPVFVASLQSRVHELNWVSVLLVQFQSTRFRRKGRLNSDSIQQMTGLIICCF